MRNIDDTLTLKQASPNSQLKGSYEGLQYYHVTAVVFSAKVIQENKTLSKPQKALHITSGNLETQQ